MNRWFGVLVHGNRRRAYRGYMPRPHSPPRLNMGWSCRSLHRRPVRRRARGSAGTGTASVGWERSPCSWPSVPAPSRSCRPWATTAVRWSDPAVTSLTRPTGRMTPSPPRQSAIPSSPPRQPRPPRLRPNRPPRTPGRRPQRTRRCCSIAGDSDAGTFAPVPRPLLADTDLVDTALDYKVSSGLARPDYFDWRARLHEHVPAVDPDIVVITFGGNDAQGLLDAGGGVAAFQPVRGFRQRRVARRIRQAGRRGDGLPGRRTAAP